jgi:transcriptional regulator with XRE-family HTH domain
LLAAAGEVRASLGLASGLACASKKYCCRRYATQSYDGAVASKAPNFIDQHVGSRMRMRRKMLAMTQTELGNALGLTFQQVQKYEKGTNRLGASRLQQLSDILQVPVEFFFEGAPASSIVSGSDIRSLTDVNQFVSSSEGLRLVSAFTRIENAHVRRQIVRLVAEIAGE